MGTDDSVLLQVRSDVLFRTVINGMAMLLPIVSAVTCDLGAMIIIFKSHNVVFTQITAGLNFN
jgi:hypothetical protein